ncbi:MAG: hypothetical protein ACHQ4G_07435 [Opitutales bacterium]
MKTNKLFTVLAASGIFMLAGCATTPAARIRNNPAAFAQLTPKEQTLVQSGQVGLGFSPDAVKLALGEPDRVTARTDAQGQVMVWHYTETVYYDGAYVYGGPYWRGWGHRGWGGYWGPRPYPIGEVRTYDSFRVEFRYGQVVAFSQDLR